MRNLMKGAKLVFLDMSNRNVTASFLTILYMLGNANIPLPFICPACVTKEVIIKYLKMNIPLVIIVKNGRLVGIIAGFHNKSSWSNFLRYLDGDGVPKYIIDGLAIPLKSLSLRKELMKVIYCTLKA